MKMYSIYDKVAMEYGPIFMAKNNEVAERNFGHLVTNELTTSGSEYRLDMVGEFNTETGNIDLTDAITRVCTGDKFFIEGERE